MEKLYKGSVFKNPKGFLVQSVCVSTLAKGGRTYSYPLPHCLDVKEISHKGCFAWGDKTECSEQLALALMVDFLEIPGRAMTYYQAFMNNCIARLPRDLDWSLTYDQMMEEYTEAVFDSGGGPY